MALAVGSQLFRRLRSLVVLLAFGVLAIVVFAFSLPLGLRVAAIWTYLLLAPGWAARIDERVVESGFLTSLGSIALLSILWDLVMLIVFWVAGVGLYWGFWILSSSALLLAVFTDFQRSERKVLPEKGERAFPAMVLLTLFVVLGAWVARQPAQARLDSDIPAHIGAIRDAQLEDQWIPQDRSFPGAEGQRDPRMGIFHGLHASVAKVLDSDPGDVWVRSASVLSPFFVLAFACLFAELGMESWMAFLASCAFAAGAWHGKPLGLWGAIYPAQVALAMGALSWAWLLRRMGGGHDPSRGAPSWWLGAIALGVSVLIHPFAWWAYCLVLAHMVILFLFLRRRREMRRTLYFFLLSGVVGAALLAPVLLHTRAAAHGAHWEPAGVLFFGSQLFTLDPAILLRWSGWSAPLALFMALILWKRWGTNGRSIAALSAALPLWTIALNPWIQPSVYAKVGYLSERLGLVAIGPALLLLALVEMSRGRRSVLRRSASVVVLFWMLGSSLPAWSSSPYKTGSITRSLLKALEAAGPSLHGPVLSDPLSSYALRATSTAVPVVLPVAHASPLDATVRKRLATLRAILSPDASEDEVKELILATGATEVLVTKGLEELYPAPEYGFVPRNDLQARLWELLKDKKADVLYESPACTLYDISGWRNTSGAVYSRSKKVGNSGQTLTEVTLQGFSLREQHVAPGDSLHVDAVFRGCATGPGVWTTVELGIVDRSTVVPGALAKISKVYRKVVLQRSLRSNDRFLFRWIAGDGYRCSQDDWSDERSFMIPEFLRPGEYSVFARIVRSRWRRNRCLEDYLNDDALWGSTAQIALTLRKRED